MNRARCSALGAGSAIVLAAIVIAASRIATSAEPTASAEPAKLNAVVQQPRSFGYVIGDIATQRVLLEANGSSFSPRELPATGPMGNWVERRAVRVERDPQGHRWLAVDYQIMNSPQALATIALPAWKLSSQSVPAELSVPEWPMTMAPLTPRQPVARVGLGELRPDRAARLVDVAPMKQRMALWLTVLGVLLATWLAWWALRNWRATSAQPFARALHELRGMDESSPQAWYALHRAFDGTTGRALQAEALPAWFARVPQFEPQRAAIEQFFAQSAARFFGTPQSGASLSLHALCTELRRIEKRHEP